jgi:hypothetical protein
MIVMIEASTHTIAKLWADVRALLKGDEGEQAHAAGMMDVLHDLGVIEPTTGQQEKPE